MKIAIDIDEVLVNTIDKILEFHNDKYKTNFSSNQLKVFDLTSLWGGTIQEAIRKIHDFYNSDYFKNMQPAQGSTEEVAYLSNDHELSVITARPLAIKMETELWIKKYFPNQFKKITMTNGWAKGTIVKKTTKAQICKLEGIDLIIEDVANYAIECSKVCKKVILFNKAWNINIKLPSNVVRVSSWSEIPALIK